MFSMNVSADYYDGNDLLKMANHSDPIAGYMARGYVAGVQDSFNGEHFCVPINVKLSQSYEIVIKYIKSDPKQWHLAGKNLIIRALSDAFPCKK